MAENSENNTTKTQPNYSPDADLNSGEEIRSDFLINEEQLGSVLDSKLKEEIAAQSLLLSALSGGNPNVVHNLNQTDVVEGSCVLSVAQTQDTTLALKNETDNYEENENSDLSFDVSQAIGVEMIAIQQQTTISDENHQQQHEDIIINDSGNITDKENCESHNEFISRQLAGTLLEAGLAGSPVVLNAIAIKGENGVTEIQFESAGGDLQMDQAEVDAMTHEHTQHETEIGKATMAVEESAINGIAANEIELPSGPQKYPRLFIATTALEAHEIIKRYAEETMSTFVSMRKMKQYGITEGGIDLKKKNYRVFFESNDVEFDGVPYVYVADKMYICHLGKDKTEVTRQKIRQQSLERRAKMGLPLKDLTTSRLRTKKIDCPVKITVKMIAKFPQFKVLRKTKRVCETASKKVRQALMETDGKLNCYYSFIGRLPGTGEHNHIVGEENSEHEPIDPLIKDKIIQLTWEGLPSSSEVKKVLEDYVEFDLFAGKSLPAKTRRRYYPNVKDIRNYMNKAKMLTRLSTDIKVELQELALKLQQSRPTENIILQSELVENNPESLLHIKTSAEDSQTAKPTLIFCHQTSQQQRLLKRYGNQVLICEVTNLIERVPFPLFCLFVQTNADYQLVASFIVEVRNKESILQGLNSVKDWNPGWSPKYVVADYSDEQCEAIKIVFPGCQQFISESSRERSWRQWLTKAENKIIGDPSKVFSQFQGIANAYNEEVLHQAALQLENSEIWRESANLRSWFNSNWLLEAKKWVIGYRPDDFIVTLHNETTIEQDIKSLREAHINFMRGKKLGSLIEKLVNRIIPDFYRRYIELNRKSYTQANELKVLYGDQLPTCLVNKPANVIVHVLDQIKSTEATVYQVSHVQPGVFWVQDASGNDTTEQPHTVSFGDAASLPSCDCLDWQRYKLPCKHLCSVFSSFPDWGWDMLNASYTANPLINLDYSCIKPWVDAQDKQDQKLGHYSIVPTFNLKGNDLKVAKSKLDCCLDKPTMSGSDIKISGVELEVPMVSKEVESEEASLVGSAQMTSLEQIDPEEEETDEIAVQCRDLLTNLAHLSSKLGKNDQIERLKADLEASIGMLQHSNTTNDNIPTDEEQGVKRAHSDDEEDDDDLKKLRVDLEKSDSDIDNSYVSDEEQVGVPVDPGTDIEDEMVEISTEQEEEELFTENISTEEKNKIELLNEDVPIETILTRPPVEVLTPEQRERKLLAILTASSS